MARDPKAAQTLSMDWTTASYKLKHGLAKALADDTLSELQTARYSLRVLMLMNLPATTLKKVLAILVSYFSDKRGEVVVEHLASVEKENYIASCLPGDNGCTWCKYAASQKHGILSHGFMQCHARVKEWCWAETSCFGTSATGCGWWLVITSTMQLKDSAQSLTTIVRDSSEIFTVTLSGAQTFETVYMRSAIVNYCASSSQCLNNSLHTGGCLHMTCQWAQRDCWRHTMCSTFPFFRRKTSGYTRRSRTRF